MISTVFLKAKAPLLKHQGKKMREKMVVRDLATTKQLDKKRRPITKKMEHAKLCGELKIWTTTTPKNALPKNAPIKRRYLLDSILYSYLLK